MQRIHNRLFYCTLAFLLAFASVSRGQSVMATGEWYKIGITEKGIYRLNKDFLQNTLGVNTDNLDPATLKIYSDGNGGALPQPNNAFRYGLTENAILVNGETDGSFDNGDEILFYGNSPDRLAYAERTLDYEKNIYSDTSFYFLCISPGPGKRIRTAAIPVPGSGAVVAAGYSDDYISYEKDITSVRSEGRLWFDYQMFSGSDLSYNIPLDVPGVSADKPVTVSGNVMAVSNSSTSFDLMLNGTELGNVEVLPIPGGEYTEVGMMSDFSFQADPATLPGIQENLDLNLTYNPVSGLANGFLDFFLLEYSRKLALYGDMTFFRSFKTLEHDITGFTLAASGQNLAIWEVTSPVSPESVAYSQNGSAVNFATEKSEILKEFVIFNTARIPVPVSGTAVKNQDITSGPVPTAVIITHPLFLEQAERLAEFHRSRDGLTVKVATTRQVYNRFSSGRQDLTAIRDYMKYFYDAEPGRLQYLLLFGDCSYDYKKRVSRDENFVPIYEARESLHPIYSYSSDDYVGFLEDEEGEWTESSRGDHTLEIGVGRLPARSREEARIFVDKIIRYATSTRSLGDWRNKIVFIADDGDSNIHQNASERLSGQLEADAPQFNSTKIYLDAFAQEVNPNGERSPVTEDRILDAIEAGALMVNYTGHGNERVWMDERVLNKESIQQLENRNKLPFFVTATCQFGKYDDPLVTSGGEELILNPNGGAIAMVTSTRLVISNTNFVLNRALISAAFAEGAVRQRFGDIIRKTKNASLRGRVNRNFALLGDPMLSLNLPVYKVRTDGVENITNANDTISALSLVKVTGSITDDSGQTVTDFNGNVTLTAFDKPVERQTLGNENSPFTFSTRSTTLFRGDATVTNGQFSAEFIVPKNIAYNYGPGKLSFYATNTDNSADAGGANVVSVGGSSGEVSNPDTTPPEIALYLNSTDFRNGGKVGKDPLLVARLTDESGISLSDRGFGQNLTGILNDTLQIDLSPYYTASADTYREGFVSYPFRDLPPGKHSLEIKVWDTHNNSSVSTVQFVVTNDNELKLGTVYNYPNPLGNEPYTTFLIEHDREGEELLVELSVVSYSGQLVYSRSYRLDNPDATITEITWDGTYANGGDVGNGVYIYKIKVSSTLDGATNEVFRRLVISK